MTVYLRVCRACGEPFEHEARGAGRPPLYCSKTCQRAWHQNRRYAEGTGDYLTAEELAEVQPPAEKETEPLLPPVDSNERFVLKFAKCKGDRRFVDLPNPGSHEVKELRAICATCPVFNGCRQMVDRIELSPGRSQNSAYFGCMWAGELPAQRIRRRKEAHVLSA